MQICIKSNLNRLVSCYEPLELTFNVDKLENSSLFHR